MLVVLLAKLEAMLVVIKLLLLLLWEQLVILRVKALLLAGWESTELFSMQSSHQKRE